MRVCVDMYTKPLTLELFIQLTELKAIKNIEHFAQKL